MYNTILIPTDGSTGAEVAIEHALDIAKTYDATVHTLAVIDTANLIPLGYTGDRSKFESTIEPLEAAAKDAVNSIRKAAHKEDVPVVTVVRQGTPYETILEYIDEADIDLVVMGTHGRSGLVRYVIGSVAEKVVRTSPVPVITVRMPAEP